MVRWPLVVASLAIAALAARAAPVSHVPASAQLAAHEERFAASLFGRAPAGIKLIGFKRINIDKHEAAQFAHEFANLTNEEDVGGWFFDSAAGELLAYFPVAGALLEHGGDVVEANLFGEVAVDEIMGDCGVLGRKQTEHITGGPGNVIKDGTIFLAEKNLPIRRFGSVLVYDMGVKELHDHDHEHGHELAERSGKVSCIGNHGRVNGRLVNCSDKFGIHNGRCAYRADICMDYNGYKTDCKKGSVWTRAIKLIGSDCGTALSKGHCWNEVM